MFSRILSRQYNGHTSASEFLYRNTVKKKSMHSDPAKSSVVTVISDRELW